MVRHLPETDQYVAPQALVIDYIACAAEAGALEEVRHASEALISAQDSLIAQMRVEAVVQGVRASAYERALELSEVRAGALGAEADAWRAAARNAERRARWWRGVSAAVSGAAVVWLFVGGHR